MQWFNELWTANIISFFVGMVVGYLILLTTNANAKKQQKLEVDLKAANQKLEAQQQQLEKHFEESANLLSNLAQDYKKLYTHLAQSSQTLLPETTAKLEFFQQPQLEEKQSAEYKENEDVVETAQSTEKKDNPPKDYSEGSSGILKS